MASNLSVATWRTWKGAATEPADAVIQAAIDAVELAINSECARKFVVAGAGSARTYAPTHPTLLNIHDCTSVSAVNNDGTTVTAVSGGIGYQLEPFAPKWSGETFPYSQIRLLGGATWATDNGRATVSVTATWGWATAIPAAITDATKIMAADLLEQRDVRNGVIGFTELAVVRMRANPSVMMLLAPYRTGRDSGLAI